MAHRKKSMKLKLKLKHKNSHRKHATARRTRARRGGENLYYPLPGMGDEYM